MRTLWILGAALLAAATATASETLVAVTQSCAARSGCASQVVRFDESGSITARSSFDGAEQSYFSGIERDSAGNWLVADRTRLRSFDSALQPGATLGRSSELVHSLVFDAAGNAFVSVFSFGKTTLRQYDSRGNLVASFRTPQPVYAVELSEDQCTLLYTSDPRGRQMVHRFNVCAGQAMSDLFAVDGVEVMQFRLLPDGGLLVAAGDTIDRYSATGLFLRSYDLGGRDSWRSLAISADRLTFWGATLNGVMQFSLDSGAVLTQLPLGVQQVTGIAVEHGWRAAASTAGRPASPTALSVRLADDGSGRLQLDWSDNASDEDGFEVEYKINYGSWIDLGNVARNIHTLTVSNFKHGRVYTFRLRAFNASGPSGYSNEATIYDRKRN